MTKRRVIEIAFVVLAGAVAITPMPRAVVERVYTRGLYSAVQPRLTRFGNAVPFALFDVVLVCALGAIVWIWIAGIRSSREGVLRTLAGLVLDTGAVAALLYFWFLAAWGLNYQREPLRAQLDFQTDRVTADAVRALGRQSVDAMNGLYDDARAQPWPDFQGMTPLLDHAFGLAQRDLAMRWRAIPGTPKRSLLDVYFRRAAVDGVTDPFFLETLVNQGLLPFERPFVVAHEWSHLAGYADESEANFVAWLICLRGSAQTKYSGWLSLYGTITGALPPSERTLLAERLGPGPRRDLIAMRERIASQVNPRTSRAGYAVYDRFLKANRVEAGVRSYGDVIQLLVGTRFNSDGSPVLRR